MCRSRRPDLVRPNTAQFAPALEQALDQLPSGAIPTLIGDLARFQALLSARLLRERHRLPTARVAATLEDPHLTPAQVEELLSLTEPLRT